MKDVDGVYDPFSVDVMNNDMNKSLTTNPDGDDIYDPT